MTEVSKKSEKKDHNELLSFEAIPISKYILKAIQKRVFDKILLNDVNKKLVPHSVKIEVNSIKEMTTYCFMRREECAPNKESPEMDCSVSSEPVFCIII